MDFLHLFSITHQHGIFHFIATNWKLETDTNFLITEKRLFPSGTAPQLTLKIVCFLFACAILSTVVPSILPRKSSNPQFQYQTARGKWVNKNEYFAAVVCYWQKISCDGFTPFPLHQNKICFTLYFQFNFNSAQHAACRCLSHISLARPSCLFTTRVRRQRIINLFVVY